MPDAEAGETSPSSKLDQQTIVPVYLSQADRDSAYTGCCKSSIWPLFHSMADRAIFNEEHWVAYRRVNHMFAEVVLSTLRQLHEEAKQDDQGEIPIIWIHDYHLMIVANTVRRVAAEEKIPCKIGFFLHIPFPPFDMIKIFPWKDVILQGILGADLIR